MTILKPVNFVLMKAALPAPMQLEVQNFSDCGVDTADDDIDPVPFGRNGTPAEAVQLVVRKFARRVTSVSGWVIRMLLAAAHARIEVANMALAVYHYGTDVHVVVVAALGRADHGHHAI